MYLLFMGGSRTDEKTMEKEKKTNVTYREKHLLSNFTMVSMYINSCTCTKIGQK